MNRSFLSAVALLTAALSTPVVGSTQGPPDQLKMEPTKPGIANYPPLSREQSFQLLGFKPLSKPLVIPGFAGGLLMDPGSMIVLSDRTGFGSELYGYLPSLTNQSLFWQTLREDEPKYFLLSEMLAVTGSGQSKQVDDQATCEARAYAHMTDAAKDKLAPGWARAQKLLVPTAIYRPDVGGIAYYQFPVDVGGFIVVATGEHDLPIPHWNDTGAPLTDVLIKNANGAKLSRFYKLDSLTYVAEDTSGDMVAQIGALPPRLVPNPKLPGGFQLDKWSSYKEMKAGYLANYRPLIENLRMAGADLWHAERSLRDGAWSAWSYAWAGSHSDQRLYNQYTFGSCAVGCGPVAWSMLFGWGDYRASVGDPRWSHRWGLYRSNGGFGADSAAPSSNTTGIVNVINEIHNHVATFCLGSSGATFPWDMQQADRYLSARTGATLTTHYNSLGIHEDRLRNLARDSIYNGTPAIIGTGWLNHYPLAYGYAVRSKTETFLFWEYTVYSRWFYVNQGWGGSGNGWVGDGTWFCGRLFAN